MIKLLCLILLAAPIDLCHSDFVIHSDFGFRNSDFRACGDDSLDSFLDKAPPATRPSTRPTSKPASPFAEKPDPLTRKGTITLSNGEKIHAALATTRDKPIRVWDEKAKEYIDVPFTLIKSMEASLLWEREEKEWAFKESGSDIKVYSGKTYPAREMVYKVELANGQSISGGIVAPLYAGRDDDTTTFVLNKRQKGEVGENLKKLIYVKRVDFDP